jgi:hypothetical protein
MLLCYIYFYDINYAFVGYNNNNFQSLYNDRQIQKIGAVREHGKEFNESAYLKGAKEQ